ncbi:histidine phosphatase family protein [Acetobacter sp. AN02]|uniref:SixA phosphatase family protein n=1 Tax=Acetobacter sp. AN02 TaxID=2894186 RepID=UPI0024342137|nr:histidine phosphatase family protein [Acetobacter sp. AN02]MDG6094913.1 histidine phosphatase family protein [Acetobacter sp. AN02]
MRPVEHRLILMRHAEALPPPGGDYSRETDLARPLSADGMKTARRRGAKLRADRISPDLVLCSPAMRTRQTYAALLPFAVHDAEIRIEQTLYNADAMELLARLRASPDSAHTVLLVAHNPGITELAQLLNGVETSLREEFLPATLATFRVEVDDFDSVARGWKNLGPRTSWLESFSQL